MEKIMGIYLHLLEYQDKIGHVLDESIRQIDQALKDRYSPANLKEVKDYPAVPKGFEGFLMPQYEADMYLDAMFVEDQMIALAELKIIYAFKSFEIHVKKLIRMVYPEQDISKLKEWDRVRDFFKKEKKLNVFTIEASNAIEELRVVNNALKHSDDIISKVKHIKEFKSETGLSDQLLSFYKRVRHAPQEYLQGLSTLVANSLLGK